MWTRVRLDIGWKDLAAALLLAVGLLFFRQPHEEAVGAARQAWGVSSSGGRVLLTLSVRSGLDLLLRTMRLPAGSEVLMSAWTIADMVRVVESHGLIPVPVDVDRRGNLDLESLRRAIGPRSRLLVVAHLFGARVPMGEIAKVVQQHGCLLVEDCAQAFDRVGDAGHAASDIVMHSFGPIKTATALGGAVVRVSNCKLFDSMQDSLRADPVQSNLAFAIRVIRFSILKLLTTRCINAVLWRCLWILGIDGDQLMNSLGRGFIGSDLRAQLRHQPSQALLYLLCLRWRTYDFQRLSRRLELAKILDNQIGITGSKLSNRWVYPLFVSNPVELKLKLNAAGFDGTNLSRMCVVSPPAGTQEADMARENHERLFFLPCYPDMTEGAVLKMANVVKDSAKFVPEHLKCR